MTDTLESVRRKIESAGKLGSVVRTMKAQAAAGISQYEHSVRSLSGYFHTIEMGLSACFRLGGPAENLDLSRTRVSPHVIGAIVFGSDQGFVGQFNDRLAEFVTASLSSMPEKKIVWAVGERIHSRLEDSGLPPDSLFVVPPSVAAIVPLIGQIILETEKRKFNLGNTRIFVFHNRPKIGARYDPVCQRLLPLDETWRKNLATRPWPGNNLPEVMGTGQNTLSALVREYLFVSLFRACAESLSSENASRLAAMQRAEKNINEMLDELRQTGNFLRQSAIDAELFDVIAGYETQMAGRA